MSKEAALAAKTKGNEAFTKGDYEKAVQLFTEAIDNDPTDAVFFSNRSGAYASLKQFDKALVDAEKCVELKPEFIKGYSRKGVALFGLNRLNEAKACYQQGLTADPNNASLKEGLQDVEKEINKPKANPFGALFGPDMWVKLNADPVTREYMKDPEFVSRLNMLQSNPNAFGSMMGSDPKMSAALGVILGLGAQGFSAMNKNGAAAGAGAGEDAADVDDGDSDDEDDSPSGTVQDESDKPKRTFKFSGEMSPDEAKKHRDESFAKAGQTPPEPVKILTEEEKAEIAAKQAEEKRKAQIRSDADKEKNLGNDAYKKRDFATAITHYEKAIEIDSSNIVYYNNLSAVFMEQKEYQKVIDTCLKGVEVGRANVANYVDVAKSYARVGSAYQAMDNLDQAIEFYNKSLLEDYNDKTKLALKKIEAEKKKREQEAYIDPVKSEEHKTKGNSLYNEGKFIDAITEYTEALKRNPNNYKVYSNRAACYTKLMSWGQGLDDCEKCLAVDPTFVKAYIRKGKIQHFLKQYHKALSTYDKALELEPNNAEVMEAKRATLMSIQTSDADPERAKEAMKDPEIQSILRDPTIAQVLQDMQQSPQAAAGAMRDPDIRKKIEKLIAAGVLGVK